MNIRLSEHRENYFYLFADCFLSRGYTRTMICDVSRKGIYFVNNPYYEVLLALRDQRIGAVMDMLDTEEDRKGLEDFLNHLTRLELGTLVDDISCFPAIDLVWDSPYAITNAIIDLRERRPDFGKIFRELSGLRCPYIQVRSYAPLSPAQLRDILSESRGGDFRHIQVLIRYAAENPAGDYVAVLADFPMVSLTFHSIPETDFPETPSSYRDMTFIGQRIDSCSACGVINQEALALPSIGGFIENTLYNGCLNRKISIDEDGYIKNCPSMVKSYGHIGETSLEAVMQSDEFREVWRINKDQIDTCRDCEYRRICTDCRAYVTRAGDPYAKPAKCGYDPYLAQWTD